MAERFPSLSGYALPTWVPQELIARDMHYSDAGIKKALLKYQAPYLWATEFENVHDLWVYDEPKLTINGRTYKDSETYYHSQKPRPFNQIEWEHDRDAVMRRAIRTKFQQDPSLRALLCATKGQPLLAIKPDTYWGFDARRGGENRLAELWMELRDELCGPAIPPRPP